MDTSATNAEARMFAMMQAIADLKTRRLQAIAEIKGGTVDQWYTTENEARSLTWLEGSALYYLNQLEAKTGVVVSYAPGLWTYDYWRNEAAILYKQISGEADVASWGLWQVLTAALTQSYDDTMAKLKEVVPSSTELYVWAAIIIVVLLLLAVIKVS